MNIHLQNIIAIQDPLEEMFRVPQLTDGKAILNSIEAEINAYADTSLKINETFQVFSQSELNDEEKSSTKKNAAFQRIQSAPTTNSAKKFSAPAPVTNEGEKLPAEFSEIADEMFGDW